MKNTKLRTFLLTTLVVVAACVMQARAQDSSISDSDFSSIICYVSWDNDNAVRDQEKSPFAEDVEMAPIELPLAGDGVDKNGHKNTGILHIWGVGTHTYYDFPDFKLVNADRIDSAILSNLDPKETQQPRFKALSPGTVPLIFEGNVTVKSRSSSDGTFHYLTNHVTVNVPVHVPGNVIGS